MQRLVTYPPSSPRAYALPAPLASGSPHPPRTRPASTPYSAKVHPHPHTRVSTLDRYPATTLASASSPPTSASRGSSRLRLPRSGAPDLGATMTGSCHSSALRRYPHTFASIYSSTASVGRCSRVRLQFVGGSWSWRQHAKLISRIVGAQLDWAKNGNGEQRKQPRTRKQANAVCTRFSMQATKKIRTYVRTYIRNKVRNT